jgi:hypothetical protein
VRIDLRLAGERLMIGILGNPHMPPVSLPELPESMERDTALACGLFDLLCSSRKAQLDG